MLEIGTAAGCSAIQFALAKRDVLITTVETDGSRAAQAVRNIRSVQLQDRIRVIHGDALDFSTENLFGLIFIDAAKAQYERFFEKFKRNLTPDGAIISDNISFHGLSENLHAVRSRNTRMLVRKIQKYRAFLLENTEFSTEFSAAGDGLAVSRRKEDFSRCLAEERRMQSAEQFQIFQAGQNRAIKLFRRNIPREAVMQEFRNSLLARKLGIACLDAAETAEADGMTGIIFRSIGTQSLSDALRGGCDCSAAARKFALLHRSIFSRTAPETAESYKEQLVLAAGGHAKEHAEVIRKIKRLPGGTCLCHGNFQAEHIWIQPDGFLAAGGFMNLCRGPKEYDAARAYFSAARNKAQWSARFAEAYLKECGIPRESLAPYLEVLSECDELQNPKCGTL